MRSSNLARINSSTMAISAVAMYSSRPWQPDDIEFLWDMLYQAIHVADGQPPVPRSIVDQHDIAHYLVDFGSRVGDDAQVAIDSSGARIGAAFCRRMTADDPGYGFVSNDVPEVGMAICEGWRGQGVGRAILTGLLDRHPSMSLSVDRDNTVAQRLYLRLGFLAQEGDHSSITMLRRP